MMIIVVNPFRECPRLICTPKMCNWISSTLNIQHTSLERTPNIKTRLVVVLSTSTPLNDHLTVNMSTTSSNPRGSHNVRLVTRPEHTNRSFLICPHNHCPPLLIIVCRSIYVCPFSTFAAEDLQLYQVIVRSFRGDNLIIWPRGAHTHISGHSRSYKIATTSKKYSKI